jgi:hypothetical protein
MEIVIIRGWAVPSAYKPEYVKVDTSAYNSVMCRGIPHFWCPERALWLSFDHMEQREDGWYTFVKMA